ncbi:hypothetical protein Y1Q_0004582 [Alligator mississippiensis]|uniref:Uncharacterized protein n=1 Tax=Alligator mississippiensis TaxID=8496 RepID=A0A151MHL9_ALLMI|nr:hypothetical protein Y1Q_0004582 [Alligator mississippiensis]
MSRSGPGWVGARGAAAEARVEGLLYSTGFYPFTKKSFKYALRSSPQAATEKPPVFCYQISEEKKTRQNVCYGEH